VRRRALLVAANIVAWSAFALDLRSDGVGPSRWGWDLAILRAGGRLLLEGRPLYDATEQARVHAAALRPELAKFPFAYPPITAIAVAPLALVPNAVALALVAVAGALVLAWAAKRLTDDATEALWVTASFPGVAAFFAGQLAYAALGLMAATYVLMRQGRPFGAGLVASLLAFKPTMLVAIPAALIVRRERARALSGLALGLALQAAVCLALTPGATRAYPQAAASFSAYVREHPERFDSVTWRASFAQLGAMGGVLALAAMAACAAAALFWMWRWRDDLEIVFATAVLATLACAWHCLPYDYVLIGLAAWMLRDRLRSDTGARLGALAVAASWVVAFVAVPGWRKALLATYPPALVAAAVWMLAVSSRDPAGRAGPGSPGPRAGPRTRAA